MKKTTVIILSLFALTACIQQTEPTKEIKVYFTTELENEGFLDCGKVSAHYRKTGVDIPDEFAAIMELFAGPTESEKKIGSKEFWFTNETGPGSLRDIKIENGIAFVDWRDIRRSIGNASTSCGSQMFFAPINASLTQFDHIDKVFHTIDGSAQTFYEWMQMSCPQESGACDGPTKQTLKLLYLEDPAPQIYPSFVDVSQYPKTLVASNNDSMYAQIRQPNMNWNIAYTKEVPPWAGVLRSTDQGKTWNKFFTVKDPADPDQPGQTIKFNPVGIFTVDNAIFVDIADARGAGSGEGNLVRFVTENDGATWQRTGCFYLIPENYFEQNSDVLKTPHAISQSTSCIY